MNLREALIEGSRILDDSRIEGCRFDAEVLLRHVLKKDRTFFIREPFHCISENEKEIYFNFINQRASGKPVSYIIGEKEFMELSFKVTEDVLIPRPDTEILVEEAIRILQEKKLRLGIFCEGYNVQEDRRKVPGGIYEAVAGGFKDSGIRVLDMCTGSGAIAVSLGYYVPDILLIAVDISEKALKIAEENARLNGVGNRISFVQSDLFEAVPGNDTYEMIVSNPPYIKNDDIKGLMADVKDFEPVLALDGGDDGLDFYRKIVPEAALRLNRGGNLIFEIGCEQAADVEKIIIDCGDFCNIRVLKDFAGLDRVVTAERI